MRTDEAGGALGIARFVMRPAGPRAKRQCAVDSDGQRRLLFAGGMRNNDSAAPVGRYDRTLRVVMWMDAFLSVEMVLVATIASPIMAVLGIGRLLGLSSRSERHSRNSSPGSVSPLGM